LNIQCLYKKQLIGKKRALTSRHAKFIELAVGEGTNTRISDFITEQEKRVWRMKAWRAEQV